MRKFHFWRQLTGGGITYEAPGRYKQDEAGKPFTATRLAALRREARTASIEGDDARLWPGLSFALADHPNAEVNTDWRVVAMAHEGEQSARNRTAPRPN